MPHAKWGYELIRKDPVYTYDTIQGITTEAVILHNIKTVNPWLSKMVAELPRYSPNSLHELERYVQEARDLADQDHTTLKLIRAMKHEKDTDTHPCLALIDVCALEPGGCFIIKEAVESNDRSFLIGLALIYHLLGVFTWWELDIYEDVDSDMMQLVMMRQDDENHNSDDEPDLQIGDENAWEQCKGDVWLHSMNVEVTIADVKKAKHEWIAAKAMTQKVLSQMLGFADIEFLERVINEPTAMGAWYRGIVYLIVNKFDFSNYGHINEEYDLPPPHTFAILWDADDYLAVWDEHANGYYEGGPASLSNVTYVFEDGIRTTKDKDPKSLMYVFSALFYYNPKKQSFYDAKDNDIQAYLSALRLHKWQGVLRRAIARNRKRRTL